MPYDFSVILMKHTVQQGENIRAARIPSDAKNPEAGVWLTGWGVTCGNCGLSNTLLGIQTRVLTERECDGIWQSSYNSQLQMCVYNGEGTTCQGDSGGPMSVGHVVYGVTSWGPAGCSPKWPSVYAKLGAVRRWICEKSENEVNGC